MKSFVIKCSIVILAFVVGISIYLFTASSHADFWKKDNQARVLFNGLPSAGSVVYRKNGTMVLNTAEDGRWYLLGERGVVSYCDNFAYNTPTFFTMHLPGYLYIWHKEDYGCLEAVLFNIDSAMVVGPKSIEFNSIKKVRIRVDW